MQIDKGTSDLIINATYNANAGLHSLREAVQRTNDATLKAKLHKTYQVLALVVDTLDALTPPFE